jgi:7,8-dihydropterin-6-yl-methyl-4-(beta-D-ribofuranosyl)aminobenzene 5'-phosphate synthase
MKYIAFIEIPQVNVEQYLEIWKNRIPENIKIIFPPQILSRTENNFSGVVVFEPKDFSDIFNYLEKYKSAGFKISISPIWENTEMSKILGKFREGEKKVEVEWEETYIEKVSIGSTSFLEILPLIDMKSDYPEVKVESGVSYLVKTEEINVLFDVGLNIHEKHPSPLLENMEHFGVSLKDIDAIVISHNHGDHVGGGKWAENKSFSLSGIQMDLGKIKAYTPVEMTYPGLDPYHSKNPTQIGKGVTTIGVIASQLFFSGQTLEQALAVNVENKGIVLIIGCGHQKIPKLLHRAKALFAESLYGLVGGLHFPVEGGPINFYGFQPHRIFGIGKEPWNQITREELDENISLMKQCNLQLLALSPHDSSDISMEILRENFPTTFREIKVGDLIKVPSE